MSIGSELPYQPTRDYYISSEARFEDLHANDSRSPNCGNFGNMLPHKRIEREIHGTFANENTSLSSSPWKNAVPYVPSLCMHDRQHPADKLTPEQLLFFHSDTPRGPPPPLFDEHNRAPQGTLRRLTSVTAPQQQQHAPPSTSSTTLKLPPNAWAQSPDTPRPHCSPSLSSSSSPSSSPSMHQSSSPASRLVPLPGVSVVRAGRVVSAVVEPSSEHKSSALPRGRNERNQGTGHQHLLPIHLNAMRSNSIG